MPENKQLVKERLKLLHRLDQALEGPMVFLGFVWLVLLIVELTNGISRPLEVLSLSIWVIFILDFLVKFILAPHKAIFFRKNWLTAISLIIPAFRLVRIVRIVRVLRALRGVRLIRVVASVNRGMKSLNATMKRRGFGYAVVLSIAVAFAGAAGMYTFEKDTGAFNSYWEALWWTLMVIITVGTDFWPKSFEGRALCFLLSLYGFAVFGYITATLASFFIDRDNADRKKAKAPAQTALRQEIAELKQMIQSLKENKE